MFRYKAGKLRRGLAFFMALLITFSMMPANGITVKATEAGTEGMSETNEELISASFTVTEAAEEGAEAVSIAEAEISIFTDGEDTCIVTQKTDSSGNATLTWNGASDGTYIYTVTKAGYESTTDTVNVNASNSVTLTKRATGNVSGTVVDENGQPITGATVSATGDGEPESVLTGEDGSFIISDVYVGANYVISASLTGYSVGSQSDVMGGAADVTITLTALQEDTVTVNTPNVTLKYGESSNLTVTSSSNSTITYVSSNPDWVEVDDAGKITAKVASGTVTITATSAGNDQYSSGTATCIVTLEKAEQSALQWETTPQSSIAWDKAYQCIAKVPTVEGTVTTGNEVTYSSSDESIAIVAEDGTVTFLKPSGEEGVTITATVEGNESYNKVEISYTIKAVKANSGSLSFTTEHPDAIAYSKDRTFENVATFTTVTDGDAEKLPTGTVSYACAPADVADIDAVSGTLTVKKPGTVTVTASVVGNDYYEDATASYSLTINQGEAFTLEKGVGAQTIQYGQTFQNKAVVAEEAEDYPLSTTTYNSSDEEIATVDEEGNVTALKCGTVTITVSNDGDSNYQGNTLSYQLTVELAEQTISFATDATEIPLITYNDTYNNTYANVATASNSAGLTSTVTYSSSDSSIAEVDEQGKLTIKKSGSVTITAVAIETDFLKENSVSYTLKINPAAQKLSFDLTDTPEVPFESGKSYYNTAKTDAVVVGEDTPIIPSYTIVSGAQLIEENSFNSATGAFNIIGAGTIVIKATFNGNEKYAETSATYTLKVSKASQTIGFAQDSVDVLTGQSISGLTAVSTSEAYGTGAITYSIQADANQILAGIDTSSGAITVSSAYPSGSATIQAIKAEDANYSEAIATYTINIAEWQPEDSCYILTGEKTLSDSEWFTGNVSVEVLDEYLICDVKNSSAAWKSKLEDVVTIDGNKHSISFYIKRTSDGAISKHITVTVKKDATLPTVSIETEGLSGWEKFLSIITFGKWNKETVDFVIQSADTAADDSNDEFGSGVANVQYFVDTNNTVRMDKEMLEALGGSSWNTYTDAGISLPKDSMAVVYARVTDVAGNYVYASTNGVVFDSVAPAVTFTVHTTPSEAGFYNSDVTVQILATDAAPYSGIKSIEYWIESNGVATKGSSTAPVSLYSFEQADPTYADLIGYYDSNVENSNIIISATDNNSDNVVLYVRVTDNAGNVKNIGTDEKVYTAKQELKISNSKPTIQVSYEDDSAAVETYNGVTYYNNARKAKIVITGRNSAFADALPVINITTTRYNAVSGTYDAVNADGLYTLSSWITEEGTTANGDDGTHTLYIDFHGDANYSFSVDYTDKAGNTATYTANGVTTEGFVSNYFTVDRTSPEGSVTIGESTWGTLLKTLSFHLFKNTTVSVSGTSTDGTSPIKSVEYYKTDQTEIITTNTLDSITTWASFNGFTVSSDELFTVYLKITDYAGNVRYLCSDGYIVDTTSSVIGLTVPDANNNGYYNDNVTIQVAVTDKTDDAYSGLKSVEYWVESGYAGHMTETQRENLYTYIDDGDDATHADLKKEWTGEITVSAAKNNYDDVRVYVKAIDNAGNEIMYQNQDGTGYLPLKIDITKPVINISYDVNSPTMIVGERGYYKTARTATITITERSSEFEAESATNAISITAKDADGQTVDLATGVNISTWTTLNGANPNQDTHTATVSFTADANYDLQVSYIDKADNFSETPVTIGTDTPFHFTVDKIAPMATIKVGNNSWDRLLNLITFGLWGNADSVSVKAASEDVTSPTEIMYYITSDTAAKTAEMLDTASVIWTAYDAEFTVNPDSQFVVYLKVSDYAGNYVYVNSDGNIIEQTASNIMFIPETEIATINGVRVYNGNVDVTIEVDEGASDYSGIKTVEYWVTTDGEETQRETLYSFEYTTAPLKSDLKRTFSKTVTVDATKNNSSNVVLTVKVTDNAGNVSTESLKLDIDTTAPDIAVSYVDEATLKKTVTAGDGLEHGYFDGKRTATIQITERANHFDAEVATSRITITATNAQGETVVADTSSLISAWVVTPGEEADATVHTATIDYSADANYTFSVSYTDMAQNRNNPVNTGTSITPYSFTVDTTAPTGTITVGTLGTWDKLLEVLTFGKWSKATVQVSATSEDATSPIESVAYYKTPNTKVLTSTELDAITSWTPYQSFNVVASEKFAVYLKLVDAAGNLTYISTDGIIVDDVIPAIENLSPQITVSADGGTYGVVNSDVTVSVSVVDPIKGDTKAYSGLKEISYTVYNQGSQTQSGILFSFDKDHPTNDELVQNWREDNAFIVDSELNNSNDVEVKVFAVDNAGNASEQSIKLQIDITAPRIEVRYDNNDGDATFAGNETEAYFKETRTATIIVYERNFSPENVELTITNTDGVVPTLSGWSRADRDGNGDDSTNTATLTYSADGDYTFAVTCKDDASNIAEDPDYGSSLAPTKFTIDRTLPQFSISYDNNNYRNENYYNAGRTAILTIKEHNFESSRVNVILNAKNNGQAVTLPTVGNWSYNGDVHTATIHYAEDAMYTFDIEYQDKAGNVMEDFAEQKFCVDTTAPVVTINNMVDESANSDDGNIGFTITATDTNFDVFEPELTAVIRDGNSFESVSYDIGSYATVLNGRSYTVSNIDRDGIYRIMCTVVDKAGNEFTEVNLYHANGTSYAEERTGVDTLLMFSVNRDGSTFELGSDTAEVVEQYYVQNVKENIIITEINADEVINHSISVGGNELLEGTNYNVSVEGGEGNWWKYTYSIDKSLFENEGEYNVVVASTDKAENNAFSDVKSANIKFVVDRTAPVVSVTGLADDGRYQTNEQTVTLIPSDDGGRMKSLIVKRVDEEGKSLEDLIHLEGDALEEELSANGGLLTFTLSEGLYQNVRIICMDYSTDEKGNANTYDEVFTNVSVSASAVMIFWANKTVRNIVVIGCLVGMCGIVAVSRFFWRRRRK